MTAAHEGTKRRVREEALAWFVRLNSGEASAAERMAHAHWLTASVENSSEYNKLGSVWADLDAMGDPRRALISRTVPSRAGPTRRFFLAAGAGALAASAAMVAGVPTFLKSDHATGTGEIKSVSLSDGTSVHLDAGSAIALHYSDRLRRVELLEGRALFDVTRDTDRPFVLAASRGTVTARGTRFIMHRWENEVAVSVEESAVEVSLANQPARVVHAGQSVAYDDHQIGALRAADIWSETSWMRGKLIFEDRPLRQVLADVNRYRPGVIRVTNGDLLDMRVSGVFDVGKPDGVLQAITSTLPVRSVQLSPYLVFLYPA